MANFSEQLLLNLEKSNLKPIIVAEIEGLPFILGSDTVKRIPLYGDEGLEYGQEGLVYGGLVDIDEDKQKALISLDGITRQITQTLDIDKASGSTISTFQLSLIDSGGEATKIVSGVYTDGDDILYKECVLWIGFSETSSFNQDYLVLFRGVIEGIDYAQGKVVFTLASVDSKRKQTIAIKGEGELKTQILDSTSDPTITLEGINSEFNEIQPNLRGVDFTSRDQTIQSYVKINDEIIKYIEVGQVGLDRTLSLTTRAQFGTAAATHDEGSSVEGFYVVKGHFIDIALKIMLTKSQDSGFMLPYLDRLPATSVNFVNDGFSQQNAIFFEGVNLIREFNVRPGDYIDLRDFTNSNNNTVDSFDAPIFRPTVEDVIAVQNGSYIIVKNLIENDFVPNNFYNLITEAATEGKVTFYSRYNTLGKLFGLGMNPNEIDIEKFERIRDSFILQGDVEFILRDEIDNAREWIEEQLFKPFTCFSLPNDSRGLGRLSIGIHLPPIPGQDTQTISIDNIVNPEGLVVKRNVNRYHYNVLVYRYNDTIDDEELRKRRVYIVGDPVVKSGNRTLIIEARGFRDDLGAIQQSDIAANRTLERYRVCSEVIRGIKVLFSTACLINIGDIVIFDPTNLNVIDRVNASRNREPYLMECINKSVNPFSGECTVDLLDTAFEITARYGLISPSSLIDRKLNDREIVIKPSFGAQFGLNEWRKWEGYRFSNVVIRSKDWSDKQSFKIERATSNTIMLDRDITIVGNLSDYIFEFDNYNEQELDKTKLLYAHITDGSNPFDDDGNPYLII